MPLGQCEIDAVATPVMGRAARSASTLVVVTRFSMPLFCPASTTVPHCWHSPQRPTHFAVCQPHSVHV